MAAGGDINTSVFPFIIRGINLLGVDSVELPLEIKVDVWNQIAKDWLFDDLGSFMDNTMTEIGLEDVPDALDNILSSKHQGRYLVKIA